MARLLADMVAKAFKDNCPAHWSARAYLKNRSNGTFNVCKFTYKGGMVQFLMDCDKPIGEGFQIKFMNFTAAFGDYTMAIQKGLYQILSRLRDAEMAPDVPEILSPSEIMFGLRKDGAVTYLVIYSGTGGTRWRAGGGPIAELTYTDDESQAPDNGLMAASDVDDLL